MENKDEPNRTRQNRNEQRAVSVFTAHDEVEAELIKDLLRSSGIECVVQGRMAAGVYPGFIGDLGKREILVLEGDVEAARSVLQSRQDDTST